MHHWSSVLNNGFDWLENSIDVTWPVVGIGKRNGDVIVGSFVPKMANFGNCSLATEMKKRTSWNINESKNRIILDSITLILKYSRESTRETLDWDDDEGSDWSLKKKKENEINKKPNQERNDWLQPPASDDFFVGTRGGGGAFLLFFVFCFFFWFGLVWFGGGEMRKRRKKQGTHIDTHTHTHTHTHKWRVITRTTLSGVYRRRHRRRRPSTVMADLYLRYLLDLSPSWWYLSACSKKKKNKVCVSLMKCSVAAASFFFFKFFILFFVFFHISDATGVSRCFAGATFDPVDYLSLFFFVVVVIFHFF